VGAGAKTPSALAQFADDWIGGNIAGLSAFAGTLYRYVPEIDDVATALDQKVSQIVGDAGWQGSAAAAFAKAWQRDAVGAEALALVISAAGDVVSQLAAGLSRIENALEKAAAEASAHGVQIGADGRAPSVCYADPAKESWRSSYESFRNQCMLAASNARTQAAGAVQGLYAQIGPPGPGRTGPGSTGLSPGDDTTIAGYARGFWAMNTAYRKFVDNKIPDLEKEVQQAISSAREEARQADGRFGNWTDDGQQRFTAAKTELASENKTLEAAQAREGAIGKALDFSPKEIPAVSDALGGSEGLGKVATFAADIPVLDVLAAGTSTYFNAQQDTAKGLPAGVAYPAEAGASVAGLAAGAGTAAGLLALGTPVGWAVAGAGVVAFGVGDFGHNLIAENWGADIHKHGVLAGVADGIGDSAANTAKDGWHMVTGIGGAAKHLGTGVAHTAEHVWDSIF
jgi:uncharacterized protein YukE